MDDTLAVLGLILIGVCIVVMLFTDDADPEISYKIHKWWQGRD